MLIEELSRAGAFFPREGIANGALECIREVLRALEALIGRLGETNREHEVDVLGDACVCARRGGRVVNDLIEHRRDLGPRERWLARQRAIGDCRE